MSCQRGRILLSYLTDYYYYYKDEEVLCRDVKERELHKSFVIEGEAKEFTLTEESYS